ncbi:CLUMA_CG004240, isoform A [Clunio marinus]|uniref:CLUMA_CG004240, isoform A n=1 Tax=Clunio marinus TaxID=568069 RepID=A0A1J1HR38_9DIPT|nr:CLUMA_CG004240, isoform A [Clunio marinus]
MQPSQHRYVKISDDDDTICLAVRNWQGQEHLSNTYEQNIMTSNSFVFSAFDIHLRHTIVLKLFCVKPHEKLTTRQIRTNNNFFQEQNNEVFK